MAVCGACATDYPDTLRECPQCRTPLPSREPLRLKDSATDETRLAGDTPNQGAGSASGFRPTSSGSGWLSSSGAIDHGRFVPGTVLGGRYRIVERLGRGGMGEVYRADDLKLGQPVALKFLPPDVDRDPVRLTQLHTEVRMARLVSHPNVCRMYDIDEVDGHTFLSMEYVDGEDFASLLRQVGRFAGDRALELARQLCAGLAAAHECGVIHRDLKPANIMLDSTGRVRIADFGLAGVTGETIRAGTPAYMAPEQLAGGAVTVRSDVYALGLVLYELFTGRRAIDGKTLGELLRQHEEANITPPSEIVRDLDPAIERAILRCLERDPAARPSSAIAVAASLPGGDPLGAALAAGETPSPEMVAAAGEKSALRPLTALASLCVVLVSAVAYAWLCDRLSATSLTPFDRPPAVLLDHAGQIMRTLGYTDVPLDTAYGFASSPDYLRYIQTNPASATAGRVRSGRPPLVLFWYRSSPRYLVPTGDNSNVTGSDPSMTISGMVSMILDPAGRLTEFYAVPPQVESPAAGSAPHANWDLLFAAADLNRADFTSTTPLWTPRSHSDERAAWEGVMPGWPDVRIRVEAAAYRGRPVFLQIVGPWTRPARMQEVPRTLRQRILQGAATVAALLILGAAVLVARHNLRKGRGDRKGAIRLSGIILFAAMVSWIVGATHIPLLNVELGRFFGGLGQALWSAGVLWVLYVALEPYVRRFWPSTVISWSRLLAGQWRDPQVGRDILIGCVFSAIVILAVPLYMLALPALGYPAQPPIVQRLSDLQGFRPIVATLGNSTFNAAFNALWAIFGLVALRLLLRRVWITAVAATVFFSITAGSGLFDAGPWWLAALLTMLVIGSIVYLMLRFGLLATLAFFFFNVAIGDAVLTLNPAKWFFPTSMWTLGFGAAIAFYGFYASRGGEPLLGRRILD